MRLTIFAFLFLCTSLFSSSEEMKQQALFLMHKNRVKEAIERYRSYTALSGKADFETLQEMGLILLKKGAEIQEDPHAFAMTLFGAALSGSLRAGEILEKGLFHPDPHIQHLALHFIAEMDDDRSFLLLNRAMNSPFLATRMEAAFYMAERKHPHALGQIEGLMFRLPPVFKAYFPPFFAALGTSDAMQALRRLIEDGDPQVRVESILSVAKMERDDFLPCLRRRLSHSHIAELEASLFAMGQFKDTTSRKKLSHLTQASSESVRLAAHLALFQLGEKSSVDGILEMAQKSNLFAIASLGKIPGSESTLKKLLNSSSFQVRLNAAISLLEKRDPECLKMLKEILIRDERELIIHPYPSLGRTQIAFKAVPFSEVRSKDPELDLSYSLVLREHFLKEAIHLPDAHFLKLAEELFEKGQNDLIPTLISLLENMQTDEAISLLKKGAQKITSPLIRDYCHLALYRLKEEGPYEEYVRRWVFEKKDHDLIRLRPLLPWKIRADHSDYELSAEETSKLLIDSFLSIANQRDEKSISFLLKAIEEGKVENRYVLVGLLMRASE